MVDGNITEIQLPNGNTYVIKDSAARESINLLDIDSTYENNTKTVTLTFGPVSLADATEY